MRRRFNDHYWRPAFYVKRIMRMKQLQPRRLRGYCTSKPANVCQAQKKKSTG